MMTSGDRVFAPTRHLRAERPGEQGREGAGTTRVDETTEVPVSQSTPQLATVLRGWPKSSKRVRYSPPKPRVGLTMRYAGLESVVSQVLQCTLDNINFSFQLLECRSGFVR